MPLSSKDKDTLIKRLTSNLQGAPIPAQLTKTMMTMDRIGRKSVSSKGGKGIEDIVELYDMGNGSLPDGQIIVKLKEYIKEQVEKGAIQSFEQGVDIINSLFVPMNNKLIELEKKRESELDINATNSLITAFPKNVNDTLDATIKIIEIEKLRADILAIHKNYEQQKKGLFGFGTISKEKQNILANLEKALETAIRENPDKNSKKIYESLRTTLLAERDKITPGLLGGAKLKGIIDTVITTWDTRTHHTMEKDQPRMPHKANK